MGNTSRRNFLATSVALGVGSSLRVQAAAVNVPDDNARRSDDFYHFQLGLAAYSFREYFSYMKGKSQKTATDGTQIDMFDFIEFCARQNVAGAELTSYFFPPVTDRDYFLRIKRRAFEAGVSISGTAIGNHFSMGPGERLEQEVAAAKSWIDKATEFGAPHIRFFAGTADDFAKDPDNLKFALDALQRCVDYAGSRGVFVGVENHGNLTADQMLQIVDGVESPWFGVNLDTGNFQSEDPYRDLERVAPFAINVQVKVMMMDADGNKYDADLARVSEILRSAHYKGFVVLEYEEPDPWTGVPKSLRRLRDQIQKS